MLSTIEHNVNILPSFFTHFKVFLWLRSQIYPKVSHIWKMIRSWGHCVHQCISPLWGQSRMCYLEVVPRWKRWVTVGVTWKDASMFLVPFLLSASWLPGCEQLPALPPCCLWLQSWLTMDWTDWSCEPNKLVLLYLAGDKYFAPETGKLIEFYI